MMKANETPHEMSLQEKAICLAITGRQPELPYPLKEVECADGTVQMVYVIAMVVQHTCMRLFNYFVTEFLGSHRCFDNGQYIYIQSRTQPCSRAWTNLVSLGWSRL